MTVITILLYLKKNTILTDEAVLCPSSEEEVGQGMEEAASGAAVKVCGCSVNIMIALVLYSG